MIDYEGKYLDQGYKSIVGIDEVGRGCLFGDVVAAAVIMPENRILGVNDSKKLTEKQREYLYDRILRDAIAVGIGRMDSVTIDKVNIKMATHLAMLLAIENLRTKDNLRIYPDLLLIDAEHIETKIEQVDIIKGDANCYSIACASIVAKVFRDRLCKKWEKMYPGYGIEKHKGYGTKAHRDAIKELGPSKIHRQSFLKNKDNW